MKLNKNPIPIRGQATPCGGCPMGCFSAARDAEAGGLDDIPGVLRTDVPVAALNRVVAVLFGVPLFGMLVLVSILQSSGVVDQPVLSLLIFAGVGGVWWRLMVAYGDRLLNVLQSQPLPGNNGRI